MKDFEVNKETIAKDYYQAVEKPFPGEHAARVNNPDKYKKIRRQNNKFGKSIHVIWGIRPDSSAEVQSIRFDKTLFTIAQAKTWLKENEYTEYKFEAAIDKELLNVLLDDKREYISVISKILKVEEKEELKLVYGIVLKPNVADAHGDIMTEDEIRDSAHTFMKTYRIIGEQHEKFVLAVPVESYIAPTNFEMGKNVVPKGSWMLVTNVLDESLWQKIKKKELNAYSAGGFAFRRPKE